MSLFGFTGVPVGVGIPVSTTTTRYYWLATWKDAMVRRSNPTRMSCSHGLGISDLVRHKTSHALFDHIGLFKIERSKAKDNATMLC